MAELRRSKTTFRRSGSSGLVWDETFLASRDHYPSRVKNHRDDGRRSPEELQQQRSKSSTVSRHGIISPVVDRPSPSPLYFCCPFPGKSSSTKPQRPRRR
ncbi:MAPK kinase substrate protein At1g80180-like [Zingiber officinale]|uniref:Uncharacterized protein n=1 Tax=Zingiber officinale TaxID=94328 RepID=A0A8J5G9R4_ZINOF|nr:MAPK kinase substrate protein At1g80180-like [Zingiber officinale]KAG6498604.1 hypothetical protein ZIOFF_038324 [Zingiber officinale]